MLLRRLLREAGACILERLVSSSGTFSPATMAIGSIVDKCYSYSRMHLSIMFVQIRTQNLFRCEVARPLRAQGALKCSLIWGKRHFLSGDSSGIAKEEQSASVPSRMQYPAENQDGGCLRLWNFLRFLMVSQYSAFLAQVFSYSSIAERLLQVGGT